VRNPHEQGVDNSPVPVVGVYQAVRIVVSQFFYELNIAMVACHYLNARRQPKLCGVKSISAPAFVIVDIGSCRISFRLIEGTGERTSSRSFFLRYFLLGEFLYVGMRHAPLQRPLAQQLGMLLAGRIAGDNHIRAAVASHKQVSSQTRMIMIH
jgi:hypothetical protein